MKIIPFLVAILLGFSAVNAEETLNRQQVSSSLYMRSAEDSCIGEGKIYAYLNGKNGHFTMSNPRSSWKQDAIEVVVEVTEASDYKWPRWDLRFSAPKNKILQPGFYKTTAYDNEEDHYELSVSGYFRASDSVDSEFEIFEIKRNARGEIVSFAADFVYRSKVNGPPLYGSVRCNSAVPVKTHFTEFFSEKAEFSLYLTKYNPTTGEKSQPLLISKGENNRLTLKPLRYRLEGIDISINEANYDSWEFKFSPGINERFGVGSFVNATNYPYHPHEAFRPRMEMLIPWRRFNNPHFDRSFRILELVRGEYREIQSLALNFIVQTYEGEILQGAFRFNSKVPVNPENPYYDSSY